MNKVERESISNMRIVFLGISKNVDLFGLNLKQE